MFVIKISDLHSTLYYVPASVKVILEKEAADTQKKMCILYNQRDATYTMFFIIIISALHVSGCFSAHHQGLIKLYVQP
jgi:hypothetical protein